MNRILIILLGFGIVLSSSSCSKKMAVSSPSEAKTSTAPAKPMAATNTSDAMAVDVLKNYIDAIGGKDKLSAIKTMMSKMTATTSMGDLTITQFVKDGKLSMKTEMGGSTVMEQTFDGKVLQVSGMGGKQTITDEATLKATRRQTRLFDELDQLLSTSSLKKFIGVEDLDGKKVNKITITDADKAETTQYFDVATKYLVRTITTTEMMGQKGTQTLDMADYKDVNGVKFPHSIKLTGGAVPFPLDMKIVSLMINSDLPDQLFKIN
ncbi:MAG: hypothetical protein ABI761_04700 [Saprospiraceae bacterium]